MAIAQVSAQALTVAQLTDINNTPYCAGSLGIWKGSSDITHPADFVAPDFNVSVAISGDTSYHVENQLFELTDQVSPGGNPLLLSRAASRGLLGLGPPLLPAGFRVFPSTAAPRPLAAPTRCPISSLAG